MKIPKWLLRKLFSLFTDSHHIGGLKIDFSLEPTVYTSKGARIHEKYIFGDNAIDEEKGYERTFETGEGGILSLTVYPAADSLPWTIEDKTDFDVILDVFYFHLGRYRLINLIKTGQMTDYKTGIPNSDGFLEYAKELFENNKLLQYNAYYFNLKGFSLVNRKFGMIEADEIICRYTKVLIEFKNDDECIGRLGGDNFVALIKKERNQQFLDMLAGVEVYGIIEGEQIPVTISAVTGVFDIDESISNYGQVLGRCGMALNIAKNVAKQPYMYATKEMNSRVYHEKQIINAFPKAIENEEFCVYYQPKVETDSYSIVGAEALVRWFCNGEMVSPADFIPVLERDGLICRLDFYVLEQVCKDIKSWEDKGISPVRVSVNFSRKHLLDSNFADDILNLLDKYDVDRQFIEVEVTETTEEDEQGALSVFMDKMQDNNINTAIDDFGTGYSSLNILRSFPVNILKIDKSFIDGEHATENDTIVLTNIIRMAKQLNMDVITEGVEKWEQVEFLHDIECTMVQGFLFDKPLHKKEFEERMKMRQYDVTKVCDYSYN